MDAIVNRLEISGILGSRFRNPNWKSRLWPALSVFLLTLSIFHIATNLTGLFMSFLFCEDDLVMIIIDQVSFAMQHSFVVVRIMTFRWQSSQVLALVDELKETHKADQFDGEEVKKLHQKTQGHIHRLDQVFRVTFGCFALAASISLSLQCLLTGKLIIRGWYPVDVASSPGFEIVSISLFLYSLVIPVVIGQIDMFLVCFLYNLASEFHVACYQLQHVREQAVSNLATRSQKNEVNVLTPGLEAAMFPTNGGDLEDDVDKVSSVKVSAVKDIQLKVNSEEVDTEMNRILNSWVDRHVALIRLTHKFEKIFNPLLSFQIATNLFLTSLSLFLMTMEGPTSHRLILLASTAWLLITELLFFCYLADKITTRSARLRDCAYSCAWLRSSARFSKSLRVVMSMSNRDLRVRVAGHVPLSMETFAQITKFSWSLLTLARTLANPVRKI